MIQSIYRSTRVNDRVNEALSDDFEVFERFLLFTMVLEALTTEIRFGCPEKLFYDNYLAVVSERVEGLLGRPEA